MTEKTVIELSKEDLKKVLCKHFDLQEKEASIYINTTQADRPGTVDHTSIKIEAPRIKASEKNKLDSNLANDYYNNH